MRRARLPALLGALALSGCGATGSPAAGGDAAVDELPDLPPLPVQQARVYPETVTGRFVPLADFEDAADGTAGSAQVRHFALTPPPEPDDDAPAPDDDAPAPIPGELQFTLRRTRTGIGALEVLAPPGRDLLYAPPVGDFSGYTLLSMSIHCPTIRDDFRVRLATRAASWTSPRRLLRAGWNTVLIDLRRPDADPAFDLTDVRRVRMGFAAAAGPVRFNVDDIMLIHNARRLRPAPDGMTLRKEGLDYTLARDDGRSYTLAAGPDGLWRLAGDQADLTVAGEGQPLPPGEALELLGRRRIGAVELLEHNAVRVRLASTWYFPDRRGAWASRAVRRVRWVHTFYDDGRRVTHLAINNAGGRRIAAVAIRPAEPCATPEAPRVERIVADEFDGPVGQWSWLCAPDAAARRRYARPPGVRVVLGEPGFAPGDADRDRFDESQGCYFLRARAGNCRFVVAPAGDAPGRAVFRVEGRWTRRTSVNAAGCAVRNVVRLPDGDALFALSARADHPTPVEVTGPVPPAAGP